MISLTIKNMEMPTSCPVCPFCDAEYGECLVGAAGDFYTRRENCPLVEITPESIPRGHWVGIDDFPHETWECDRCGKIIEADEPPNYCENCGAKMDGEENGN